MSDQHDPRLEQPGASDDSLLAAHETELLPKPDDRGHYRMAPLILLFVFSGIIFYAGTYLNEFAGGYKADVFNEDAPPVAANAGAPKIDPMVLGKRNYDTVCATCHQQNGLGVAGIYPPLAESEWVTGSAERVIRVVAHGLQGPITVKGQQYGAAPMPAFARVPGGGYNWNEERLAAVLTYIRASWGNAAEPITTDQVRAVLQADGPRGAWTESELSKFE